MPKAHKLPLRRNGANSKVILLYAIRISWIAGFILLLAPVSEILVHRSNDAIIFGRYNLVYFAFVSGYFLFLAVWVTVAVWLSIWFTVRQLDAVREWLMPQSAIRQAAALTIVLICVLWLFAVTRYSQTRDLPLFTLLPIIVSTILLGTLLAVSPTLMSDSNGLAFARMMWKSPGQFLKTILEKLQWSTVFPLFIIALIVRLIYITVNPQTPIVGDPVNYIQHAEELISSGLTDPYIHSTLAFQGPGYPIFLAITAWISGASIDPQTIRLVQAVVDSANCIIIYFLGMKTANRKTGIIASLIAAFYPPLIFQAGKVLSDTLGIFLLSITVLVLVQFQSRQRSRYLALSAVMLAISCLTRVTLLPFVPVYLIAILILRDRGEANCYRIRDIFIFLVFFMVILYGYGAVFHIGDATWGSSGASFILEQAQQATHPAIRGWAGNIDTINVTWWQDYLEQGSIYPVFAVLNPVFFHYWFANNPWQETFILSPNILQFFHRLLILLALGGIAFSFRHWRRYILIYPLLLGASVLFIKKIEIRHNLVVMPYLFLFSALFVAECVENISKATKTRQQHLVRYQIMVALVMILMVVSASFHTRHTYLPYNRMMLIIGPVSDVIFILGCLVVIGYSILLNGPKIISQIVGAIPAAGFLALHVSFLVVDSSPRWAAWSVDITQYNIVEEITLSDLIDPGEVVGAAWLVDMQLNRLDIGISAQHAGATIHELSLSVSSVCSTPYVNYSSFSQTYLEDYPQWVRIPVPVDSILGVTKIAVTLEASRDDAEADSGYVLVNGTYNPEKFIPDILGSCDGAYMSMHQSLYQWVVIDEWRYWRPAPATTAEHASFIISDGERIPISGRSNIFLIVTLDDGTQIVY